MPELPEVETTRRGLTPQVVGRRIVRAVVRNRALRWPVPAGLARTLAGLQVRGIGRRAKYLIIDCSAGSLIVHLGMSGRMRIVPADTPAQKHDHLDLVLDNGMAVRLTDPRRFGAVLWVRGDPEQHKLLMNLGPEPLGDHFDARWLFQHTRGKTAAIKNVLMDSRVVAGVGNIYASEALFRAGINPKTAAGKLRLERCRKLTAEVKATLTDAIAAGGSSMRDYVAADGQAGYFQNDWRVYGRAGKNCMRCAGTIRLIRQGQRSTFYCARCQK